MGVANYARVASRASLVRDCLLVAAGVFVTLALVAAPPAHDVHVREFDLAPAPPLEMAAVQRAPPRARSSGRRLQGVDAGAEANVAYFIQIAGNTAAHLPRLMRRMHHPRNTYAIHFDKKMPLSVVRAAKEKLLRDNPTYARNVHFMKSELITYRGVSMVLNTIKAMKFLLDRNDDWDYMINISGSDYPLVTPLVQRRLLGKTVDRAFNFFTFAPPERWAQNLDFRTAHFYVDEALSFSDSPDTKVRQSGERNPLRDLMHIRYVNAEAWMINSRQFCNFVVSGAYARKLLLSQAFSVETSEHYFATLAWNHPRFNRTIVDHSLRSVIWEHNGRSAGQHPFYVDEVDAAGKFTFREAVRTAPQFFTRKFKQANSPLMDVLDDEMDSPEKLDIVEKHFNWRTSMAIEINAAKPALLQRDDHD